MRSHREERTWTLFDKQEVSSCSKIYIGIVHGSNLKQAIIKKKYFKDSEIKLGTPTANDYRLLIKKLVPSPQKEIFQIWTNTNSNSGRQGHEQFFSGLCWGRAMVSMQSPNIGRKKKASSLCVALKHVD